MSFLVGALLVSCCCAQVFRVSTLFDGIIPVPEVLETFDQLLTVGARFNTTVRGNVTAIRFLTSSKSVRRTRVCLLYGQNPNRQPLARVSIAAANQTDGGGWQTCPLETPVSISPNVSYIVSAYSQYRFYTANYWKDSRLPVQSGDLVLLPNGIWSFGEALPQRQEFFNYWVDVVFQSDVPQLTQTQSTGATTTTGDSVASTTSTTSTASTSSAPTGTITTSTAPTVSTSNTTNSTMSAKNDIAPSDNTAIAIGVGVAVGVCVLLALALFAVWFLRKSAKESDFVVRDEPHESPQRHHEYDSVTGSRSLKSPHAVGSVTPNSTVVYDAMVLNY